MKILIVDDDPTTSKSLEGLPMDISECHALRRGDAAVRAVRNALKHRDPFDLITIDIALPDMDGTKVALEIRKLEKDMEVPKERAAFIMIITAHADEGTVRTSFSAGCNAFVVKPFKNETIVNAIAKSKLKSQLLKDPKADQKAVDPVEIVLSRLASGKIRMASLPEISIKLNEMAKKGLDFKVIGNLIKQDMAITAKIMSVSNSAYYGAVAKTKTVDEAISRLGLVSTKQYVDAICNRKLFVTADKKYTQFAKELWEHSLYCAVASQVVVETLKLELKSDAFSIGLLHDIGKIFLLQMSEELEAKNQLSGNIDSESLFRSIEKHHNMIGAKALKSWNFSKEYIEGALLHDDPGKTDTPSKELLVLHFANSLAKTMTHKQPSQADENIEDLDSTRLLKITPDIIVNIKERVEKQLPLYN